MKLKELTHINSETNHFLYKQVIINSFKAFLKFEIDRVEINGKSKEGARFKGFISKEGLFKFFAGQREKELNRIEVLIGDHGHEMSAQAYENVSNSIEYLESYKGDYTDFDLNKIVLQKDFVNDFISLVRKK